MVTNQTLQSSLHALTGKSRNRGKQPKSAIHPDSRRARQLSREIAHREKQSDAKVIQKGREKEWYDTVEWFANYVENNHSSVLFLSVDQVEAACRAFVTRFDAIILSLRSQKKGTARHLENYRMQLENAYTEEGLDIPDVSSRSGMRWLRSWDKSQQQARRIPRKNVHFSKLIPSIDSSSEPHSLLHTSDSSVVFTLGKPRTMTMMRSKKRQSRYAFLVSGQKKRRVGCTAIHTDSHDANESVATLSLLKSNGTLFAQHSRLHRQKINQHKRTETRRKRLVVCRGEDESNIRSDEDVTI